MGTNKAEELIKKLEILEDSCDSNLALVVNGYSSGVSDSIKIVKEYLTNRQSEIDELTKEVERLKELCKKAFIEMMKDGSNANFNIVLEIKKGFE